MKQIAKLKLCDWTLLAMTPVVLASGIQLEVLAGRMPVWTWIHVGLCTAFMGLCAWHIWLHFKRNNWFERFHRQKSQVTRILWWTGLITLLTAIIATVHLILSHGHVPVGAVHGKIGFLMILLVVCHAAKRRKFYLPKKK